jgi:hypothetical protein
MIAVASAVLVMGGGRRNGAGGGAAPRTVTDSAKLERAPAVARFVRHCSLHYFRQDRSRSSIMLGDAVVVAVRRASATIRVERATDVLFLGHDGDWVAPQAPVPARKH